MTPISLALNRLALRGRALIGFPLQGGLLRLLDTRPQGDGTRAPWIECQRSIQPAKGTRVVSTCEHAGGAGDVLGNRAHQRFPLLSFSDGRFDFLPQRAHLGRGGFHGGQHGGVLLDCPESVERGIQFAVPHVRPNRFQFGRQLLAAFFSKALALRFFFLEPAALGLLFRAKTLGFLFRAELFRLSVLPLELCTMLPLASLPFEPFLFEPDGFEPRGLAPERGQLFAGDRVGRFEVLEESQGLFVTPLGEVPASLRRTQLRPLRQRSRLPFIEDRLDPVEERQRPLVVGVANEHFLAGRDRGVRIVGGKRPLGVGQETRNLFGTSSCDGVAVAGASGHVGLPVRECRISGWKRMGNRHGITQELTPNRPSSYPPAMAGGGLVREQPTVPDVGGWCRTTAARFSRG